MTRRLIEILSHADIGVIDLPVYLGTSLPIPSLLSWLHGAESPPLASISLATQSIYADLPYADAHVQVVDDGTFELVHGGHRHEETVGDMYPSLIKVGP